MSDIAIVRQQLSKTPGVSRTWFEWGFEEAAWVKTLVVEVEFDTDPNSSGYQQGTLDAIAKAATGAKTTMVVSHLKVVPKSS